MPGEFLFKNEQEEAEYTVGKNAEATEQKGLYLDSMNEFERRNADLQQSLWNGRDSESMQAVKHYYSLLSRHMKKTIPADDAEFENSLSQLDKCYSDLITVCGEYIKSHRFPITPSGRQRKAMVRAVLSSAQKEHYLLETSASSLKSKRQDGMIWGNIFGVFKEDIEFCASFYTHLDSKLSPLEGHGRTGAVTTELACVISASEELNLTDARGKLLTDMATTWASNYASDELRSSLHTARRELVKRLVATFNSIVSFHILPSNISNVPRGASRDVWDDALRQLCWARLSVTEDFKYWKAIRKVCAAVSAKGDIEDLPGEAELLKIPGTDMSKYPLLKQSGLQDFFGDSNIFARINARRLLDPYVDRRFLNRTLGGLVVKHATNADPLPVEKMPTPKEAGNCDLNTAYGPVEHNNVRTGYLVDTNDRTKEEKKYLPDGLPDEEGATILERAHSLTTRLTAKYGSEMMHDSTMSYSGKIKLDGLVPMRVLSNLERCIGAGMTGAKIEALYDKLMSRKWVGQTDHPWRSTHPGVLTEADSDTILIDGIYELIDQYYIFAKRIEKTYGRLLGQLHPEDVVRQYSTDLIMYISGIQDMQQLIVFLKQHGDSAHGDFNDPKIREFFLLANYFMDFNNRLDGAITGNISPAKDGCGDAVGAMDYAHRMAGIRTYSTIAGPAMTPKQAATYRANLRKRFKSVGERQGVDWSIRLFGEFEY